MVSRWKGLRSALVRALVPWTLRLEVTATTSLSSILVLVFFLAAVESCNFCTMEYLGQIAVEGACGFVGIKIK